jgi:putative flavoprotein involved in K+ transport
MQTDVVIIGGGQAGLAMSHCLTADGIDHVVLERGRTAERWGSERWDSLRLLTPNWMSRLPGWHYTGPDPDGYMTMEEIAAYFEEYARSFQAPLQTETTVERVSRTSQGFDVRTDRGRWQARAAVIATGWCDVPAIPAMAAQASPAVLQLAPGVYRHPGQLPPGGVLIVGAAATGIQFADEILASGRPVTLAVSRHLRLPRRYRGRDILWWFDRMGLFDERAESVHDIEISRHQPSMQLIGRPDHATLDLQILERRGVRLTGRLSGLDGDRAYFQDDLVAYTAAADIKLAMLRRRIDQFVERTGLQDQVEGIPDFEPWCWPAPAPTTLDLEREGIATIIWATGYRRSYPWLDVPVLDSRGEIRHDGGVTPVGGLYVLGLQFQRRRKSSFIDGVGDDARDIAAHVASVFGAQRRATGSSPVPMTISG